MINTIKSRFHDPTRIGPVPTTPTFFKIFIPDSHLVTVARSPGCKRPVRPAAWSLLLFPEIKAKKQKNNQSEKMSCVQTVPGTDLEWYRELEFSLRILFYFTFPSSFVQTLMRLKWRHKFQRIFFRFHCLQTQTFIKLNEYDDEPVSAWWFQTLTTSDIVPSTRSTSDPSKSSSTHTVSLVSELIRKMKFNFPNQSLGKSKIPKRSKRDPM